MGEIIVIFMVLVFIFGLAVVIRDVLRHAKKQGLTKSSN